MIHTNQDFLLNRLDRLDEQYSRLSEDITADKQIFRNFLGQPEPEEQPLSQVIKEGLKNAWGYIWSPPSEIPSVEQDPEVKNLFANVSRQIEVSKTYEKKLKDQMLLVEQTHNEIAELKNALSLKDEEDFEEEIQKLDLESIQESHLKDVIKEEYAFYAYAIEVYAKDQFILRKIEEQLSSSSLQKDQEALQKVQQRREKNAEKIQEFHHLILEMRKQIFQQAPSSDQNGVESSRSFLKDISYSVLPKNILEDQHWQYTELGQILVDEPSIQSDVAYYLGQGFQASCDRLRLLILKKEKEIHDLEKKAPGNLPQRHLLNAERLELKKSLQQTVLLRVIQVRGEKERELQKLRKEGKSESVTRDQIRILEEGFARKLLKFTAISDEIKENKLPSEVSESVWKLLFNEFKNTLFSFVGTHSYEGTHLEREMKYARLGYDMMENVKEYLLDLQKRKEQNEPLSAMIFKEAQEFISWADAHPRASANLASDICITCSALGGGSSQKQIIEGVRAKALTSAFVLGLRSEEIIGENIETKQELRFKALADICRYAPIAGGLLGGALRFTERKEWSVGGALKDISTSFFSSFTSQKLVDYLTPHQAHILYSTGLYLATDENYRELVVERSTLEAIEQAGKIKDVVFHPMQILRSAQTNLSFWWRCLTYSMTHSPRSVFLKRALVQVGVPVLAIGASVALVGIPAVFALATVPLTIPATYFFLKGAQKLYSLLYLSVCGQDISTDLEIKAQIREEKIKAMNQSDPSLLTQIPAYFYSLPRLSSVSLKENEDALISQEIKIAVVSKISNELTSNWKNISASPTEVLEFFQAHASIEKLKTEVEQSQGMKNFNEKMAFVDAQIEDIYEKIRVMREEQKYFLKLIPQEAIRILEERGAELDRTRGEYSGKFAESEDVKEKKMLERKLQELSGEILLNNERLLHKKIEANRLEGKDYSELEVQRDKLRSYMSIHDPSRANKPFDSVYDTHIENGDFDVKELLKQKDELVKRKNDMSIHALYHTYAGLKNGWATTNLKHALLNLTLDAEEKVKENHNYREEYLGTLTPEHQTFFAENSIEQPAIEKILVQAMKEKNIPVGNEGVWEFLHKDLQDGHVQ